MLINTYHNFNLHVFESEEEFMNQYQAQHMEFVDSESEESTESFSKEDVIPDFAMKEDAYESLDFNWLSYNDGTLNIVCIIINQSFDTPKIERDVFMVVAHELGHLISVKDLKDTELPYSDFKGFIQEETKAIWFEYFAKTTFDISQIYLSYLRGRIK